MLRYINAGLLIHCVKKNCGNGRACASAPRENTSVSTPASTARRQLLSGPNHKAAAGRKKDLNDIDDSRLFAAWLKKKEREDAQN